MGFFSFARTHYLDVQIEFVDQTPNDAIVLHVFGKNPDLLRPLVRITRAADQFVANPQAMDHALVPIPPPFATILVQSPAGPRFADDVLVEFWPRGEIGT